MLYCAIGLFRDPFPKTDLHGGYIGDKIPLCIDLPSKHYLKEGATYRLLGSSPQPELHNYGWYIRQFGDRFKGFPGNSIMTLDATSQLKAKLLSRDPIVTLDISLTCVGSECDIDTLFIVKIQDSPPIYYEYERQPCVELSFYDNAKIISSQKSMCGNPKVEAAYDLCCPYYLFERTTQSTSKSRCSNDVISNSSNSNSTYDCISPTTRPFFDVSSVSVAWILIHFYTSHLLFISHHVLR